MINQNKNLTNEKFSIKILQLTVLNYLQMYVRYCLFSFYAYGAFCSTDLCTCIRRYLHIFQCVGRSKRLMVMYSKDICNYSFISLGNIKSVVMYIPHHIHK